MEDRERVRRLVAYCARTFKTSNPFEIADGLGVLYQIGNLKQEGCYMFLKNHRYIFLSNRLSRQDLILAMAHELGHALLDRKSNCYFIRNKTLILNSKLELRANLFAAFLLISDDLIEEYKGCTIEQMSRGTGYPKELIELRLKQP